MIDWNKPVLIGGMHRTFRLSGQINSCPLVVTVDGPQAVETLYVVAEDGSSKILNYDARGPIKGPKFENEPQETKVEFFTNIYKGGKRGFTHPDINSAVASRNKTESNMTSCLATAKVTIKVDDFGNVSGSVMRA